MPMTLRLTVANANLLDRLAEVVYLTYPDVFSVGQQVLGGEMPFGMRDCLSLRWPAHAQWERTRTPLSPRKPLR